MWKLVLVVRPRDLGWEGAGFGREEERPPPEGGGCVVGGGGAGGAGGGGVVREFISVFLSNVLLIVGFPGIL